MDRPGWWAMHGKAGDLRLFAQPSSDFISFYSVSFPHFDPCPLKPLGHRTQESLLVEQLKDVPDIFSPTDR